MPAIGLCLSWCTRGKDARGPCQVVVWGALGSLGGDGGGGGGGTFGEGCGRRAVLDRPSVVPPAGVASVASH